MYHKSQQHRQYTLVLPVAPIVSVYQHLSTFIVARAVCSKFESRIPGPYY